ncbi:MAG: hypothetical protein ABSA45_00505 [Verrucomicrobiota bacterium]
MTTLVGIVACGLVVAELAPASNPEGKANLAALNQRVTVLRQIDDPIRRDSYCVPLSAYCRALDHALDKNARVFLSGMVGRENAGRGGYYYFLRNYLFPRDVEISLGRPAIFYNEWRDGVDCDSPETLRTNGFDLFLRFETNNNIAIIPLTEKGVPKQ